MDEQKLSKSRDQRVFNEIRMGNIKAFDYIFCKYYSGLCLYAYRLVNSRSASQDIVQDFFLKIWEKRQKIIIQTNVKSYLFKSVHNRCLDYLEHQKIKANHKIILLQGLSQEDCTVNQIQDAELETLILKSVYGLPDRIRNTFVLNRFNGLSYPEISKKEKVSVKAIEYRITKALKLLRENLQEYMILIFSIALSIDKVYLF
jgi:RNA polymerase sigma-70 factor, ECF subfamily